MAALVAGAGIALLAGLVLQAARVWVVLPLSFWSLVLILPLGAVAGIAVTASVRGRVPIVFQLAKFGLVGLLSAMIDLGVLNLLMEATGVYRRILFPLLKGASFLMATTNAFLWNRNWTFHDAATSGYESVARQFSLYTMAAAGGLALNVLAATVWVNVIPIPNRWQLIQWANLGAILGLGATATWDFLCYKFIVFRAERAQP